MVEYLDKVVFIVLEYPNYVVFIVVESPNDVGFTVVGAGCKIMLCHRQG